MLRVFWACVTSSAAKVFHAFLLPILRRHHIMVSPLSQCLTGPLTLLLRSYQRVQAAHLTWVSRSWLGLSREPVQMLFNCLTLLSPFAAT